MAGGKPAASYKCKITMDNGLRGGLLILVFIVVGCGSVARAPRQRDHLYRAEATHQRIVWLIPSGTVFGVRRAGGHCAPCVSSKSWKWLGQLVRVSNSVGDRSPQLRVRLDRFLRRYPGWSPADSRISQRAY